MTLVITKIRESFDVRDWEWVSLLEVIMSATSLILTEQKLFFRIFRDNLTSFYG